MIGYAIVGSLALSAFVGTGAFFYGQKLEAVKHTKTIASLEHSLAQLHKAGVDLEERSKKAGTKAAAELELVRKQAKEDRAIQSAEIRVAWASHFDAERVRAAQGVPGDVEPALTACRADAAAARGALDQVLTAALGIREVALLNTEQLKKLQAWVREVSKQPKE